MLILGASGLAGFNLVWDGGEATVSATTPLPSARKWAGFKLCIWRMYAARQVWPSGVCNIGSMSGVWGDFLLLVMARKELVAVIVIPTIPK